MSKPPLKTCPFCGGAASFLEVPTDDPDEPNAGGNFIQCVDSMCGMTTQWIFGEDADRMLSEKWNRRADNPQVQIALTLAQATSNLAAASTLSLFPSTDKAANELAANELEDAETARNDALTAYNDMVRARQAEETA